MPSAIAGFPSAGSGLRPSLPADPGLCSAIGAPRHSGASGPTRARSPRCLRRRAASSHERVLVHRTRSIHPEDRARADGIPVTSVPRTLLDLADVVSARRLGASLRGGGPPAPAGRQGAGVTLLERANGRHHRNRLSLPSMRQFRPAPRSRSELERRFIDLIRTDRVPGAAGQPDRRGLRGRHALAIGAPGGRARRPRVPCPPRRLRARPRPLAGPARPPAIACCGSPGAS